MKKLIIALVICLAMVGLMAAPVMANAPTPPPKLTFATDITSDGVELHGSLNSYYTIMTYGVPAMHTLGLTETKSNPQLADGSYAFKLQAGPSQQAALTSYFGGKGWPTNYLTQIASEINGTAPFFYLNAATGVYTLGDGFTQGLGGGYSAPLRIDDDYPVGTYVYTGTLTGTNGATLNVTVRLVVMRVKPKLTFATDITSDGVELYGSLNSYYTITTYGVAGTMHTLGLTETKSNPQLADGNYAFTLKAGPSQQAALTAYFAAKNWGITAYYNQINAEIAGSAPFFYLNAASGVYTLGDGFTAGLTAIPGPANYAAPLLIDDDYPVGTYTYTGTLTGTNGATLNVTVRLVVKR